MARHAGRYVAALAIVLFVARQATAQPTLGATSVFASTPATTVAVIDRPAGVVAGDIIVTCLATYGGNLVPPSGWTQHFALLCTYSTPRLYAKPAGGSEPATYTWTGDNAGWNMVSFSVQGAAATFDASGSTCDAAYDATMIAGSITTTETNCLLVAFFSGTYTESAWSTPSGMTARANSGAGNTTAGLFDEVRAEAGATGSRTSTMAGGWSSAIMLAFAPSGGGAGQVRHGSPTHPTHGATDPGGLGGY